MAAISYLERRGELQTYFDRTAAEAWARLTSDAPVGRIRATVRAGRDAMRATLLSWLPDDMRGLRLLDAGCGTGALAVAAARRGARVTAIDLSPTLVAVARERMPRDLDPSAIEFRAGDMLAEGPERFDAVIAMDSLIHYRAADICRIMAGLAARCDGPLLVTFAPRTPALSAMHTVGRLFPRGARAPAIEPVDARRLHALIAQEKGLQRWTAGRSHRIASGFYTSQALEMVPR